MEQVPVLEGAGEGYYDVNLGDIEPVVQINVEDLAEGGGHPEVALVEDVLEEHLQLLLCELFEVEGFGGGGRPAGVGGW